MGVGAPDDVQPVRPGGRPPGGALSPTGAPWARPPEPPRYRCLNRTGRDIVVGPGAGRGARGGTPTRLPAFFGPMVGSPSCHPRPGPRRLHRCPGRPRLRRRAGHAHDPLPGPPHAITELRNLPLEGNARILLAARTWSTAALKGNQVLGPCCTSGWASSAHHRRDRRRPARTATAMVCALLGLDRTIYMGATDVVRQASNVGAHVFHGRHGGAGGQRCRNA